VTILHKTESEIMEQWQGDPHSPVASICIISYNHEPYIGKALDSILTQETDFPFEVIVDDDCSTDDTAEIIRRYAERYPSIIRANLRTENVGLVRNEIHALKRARGDYVAICEGDDAWLYPGKLKYQIERMRQHEECDMSFHPVRMDYNDTVSESFIQGYIKKSKNILSEVEGDYLFSNYSESETLFSVEEVIRGGGGYIATSSLIFRREIIEQHADFIESEVIKVKGKFIDYYLQIFGAVRGGALFVPKVMSTYLLHGNGVWTSMLSERDEEALNVAESGILSVLGAVDKELQFRYHDLFVAVFFKIIKGVVRRKNISITARLESVNLYSKLLPMEKVISIQGTIINELLEYAVDSKIVRLENDQIDMLRDVALSLEGLNLPYAHGLMKIASSARPEAEFLKEKVGQYRTFLDKSGD